MLRAFLITIAATLAVATGVVATQVDLTGLFGGEHPPRLLAVGATRLLVPAGYLRAGSAEAVAAGDADLVAGWPDLAPPAAGRPEDSAPLVFLHLAPASAGVDPAERPMTLYARFFADEHWTNPGGLLMRRFRPDSPYGGEELYFSPPDGESFSARCPRRGSVADVGSANCLWSFRHGGLDIQVRFPASLLPRWTRLRDGVQALLRGWIAVAGTPAQATTGKRS
jgi:hypothetical protein